MRAGEDRGGVGGMGRAEWRGMGSNWRALGEATDWAGRDAHNGSSEAPGWEGRGDSGWWLGGGVGGARTIGMSKRSTW